jgi:acetyl esterase/lipase
MDIDPWLFGPDAIDTETAQFNRWLADVQAKTPDTTKHPPSLVRAARTRGESVFGEFLRLDRAENRVVTARNAEVGVRITRPPGAPRAVMLHIHGGGWVLGEPADQDVLNAQLADSKGVAVVSVDYGLAPEDPYPAGPDDCETAALWLIENARAEFGTDRLLIGGESAGAHLSVVTLLRLRDRHGYTGVRAANLAYGVYDLAMTPSAANWGDEPLILSTAILEWFQGHFVDRSLTREPDVSPLFADLDGLPPALFSVGTLDPVLDDSLFMAQRWQAAGNRAELVVYPGGVHAFDYFRDLELGRVARSRMNEFLAANA